MTGYTPNDAFTGADIYDLSDLVQGGATGDANIPIKALADQTNYLKNRLRRWEGVKVITGNYTIDPVADLGQFIVFSIFANTTLILPDAGELQQGTRIPVKAAIGGIKSLSVLSQGGQHIIDGSRTLTTWDTVQPGLYMHDAEKLIIVSAGDHWLVESAPEGLYAAGETYAGRVQRANTIVANGTEYKRADIPRVTLFALSLGTGIVSDLTWSSGADPNPLYRGCYSQGDGSTTIRVPDERAMFVRFLDLGRGLDISRPYNATGGFEADGNKSHTHGVHYEINGTDGTPNGEQLDTASEGNARGIDNSVITASGNVEVTVKNIGKIPLINI